MTIAFADTSYFLALLIPNDSNHISATKWAEQHRNPLVTSEYVVVEVGNFLSSMPLRRLFRPFREAAYSEKRMTIVPASADLLAHGSTLFEARIDKPWSLTDCISFSIMKERGIQEALTADHHFEQAGFSILLK